MRASILKSSTESIDIVASAEVIKGLLLKGEQINIVEATESELNRIIPVWKGQYRRKYYSSAGWLFRAGVA